MLVVHARDVSAGEAECGEVAVQVTRQSPRARRRWWNSVWMLRPMVLAATQYDPCRAGDYQICDRGMAISGAMARRNSSPCGVWTYAPSRNTNCVTEGSAASTIQYSVTPDRS